MKSELTKLSNASKPLPVLLVIRIRQRLFASLSQSSWLFFIFSTVAQAIILLIVF
jgi:hypothetical protein